MEHTVKELVANEALDFSPAQCGNWFSRDYWQCRQLFLALCERHTRHSVTLGHQALAGHNSLYTDTLWLGDAQAQKVLVLISGTHGVEGYCGSAVQSFLLNALEQGSLALPDNSAVLFIHALNPWGMQWARRCDHNGVDLNRNFTDFTALPSTPVYYPELLQSFTLARSARRQSWQQMMLQMGREAFEQLLSGGQFDHAWAPFYGGNEPAWANQLINQVIDHWQLAERELVVLDLHTGLGPYAFGELISDHAPASAASHYAQQVFGPAVAQTLSGESHSVPKAGLLDYCWHRLMVERGCFLTLEFGSLGTDSLFDVIVDDHLYWRDNPAPKPSDPAYRANCQQMLQHFCPNDVLWQQAALFKSWQVVSRVLAYFTRTDESNA